MTQLLPEKPQRFGDPKYYKTQFDEDGQRLLYAHVEGHNVGLRNGRPAPWVSFWSFFHQNGRDEPKRVGQEYPSEAILLADLHRFGTVYGFSSPDATYLEQCRAVLRNCGSPGSYYSILKWAEEAQQLLTADNLAGVRCNLELITARAKEEIARRQLFVVDSVSQESPTNGPASLPATDH